MSNEEWEGLPEEERRSIAKLGRRNPWHYRQRIVIPWFDKNRLDMFAPQGQDGDYAAWRALAERQEMELVIRGRDKRGTTCSIFGVDRTAIGDFLEEMIL